MVATEKEIRTKTAQEDLAAYCEKIGIPVIPLDGDVPKEKPRGTNRGCIIFSTRLSSPEFPGVIKNRSNKNNGRH